MANLPTEDAGEEQVALLPLTVFPEQPQPGQTCTFKVDRVYNDQVSVRYVSSKKEEFDEADAEEQMVESPAEFYE